VLIKLQLAINTEYKPFFFFLFFFTTTSLTFWLQSTKARTTFHSATKYGSSAPNTSEVAATHITHNLWQSDMLKTSKN